MTLSSVSKSLYFNKMYVIEYTFGEIIILPWAFTFDKGDL